MYAITGITGHVGGATARALLRAGAPIRAVVRSASKGEPWAEQGAEVAIADLADPAALAAALRGSTGAFILLPTLDSGSDAEHRSLADSITEAVAESGVPHVVLLSSLGAEIAEGTGPIRWLHHLETGLLTTGATVTALRSCHFYERVEDVLDAVLGAGIYPVFAEQTDRPVPMIATADIGEIAAERLLAPPSSHEVIDLEGSHETEQQVADLLAQELGRPIQAVTIPQEAWVPTLVESGVTETLAHELAALADADQRRLLLFRSEHRRHGRTPLVETLRHLLAGAPVT